jgi:hypothetical protein
MRAWQLTLPLALAAAACADPGAPGGLTADIVFQDAPNLARRALTTAAVPGPVGRLEIQALTADGATLAATALDLMPAEGELLLEPAGGEWTLDGVPAGADRVVAGKAYLRPDLVPGLGRQVAYAGRITGVTVTPGEITQAGVLTLTLVPDQPETDFEPPDPPNPVSAAPLAAGESLRVTFGAPAQADVAGFVLAVGTATVTQAHPTLNRGDVFAPGDLLAAGIRVHTVWPFARTEIITIDGLTDGVPVTVLVYAYDQAGNYSPAAEARGVPADTAPPDAPGGLTALVVAADAALLSFVAPAEDPAGAGTVSHFEVRTAPTREALEDPVTFATRPAVTPPAAAAPGQTVRFERSLAELGVVDASPVYVGVRAVDAAANAGLAAVTQLILSATVAPTLAEVDPPVGLAGRELVLSGLGFGPAQGTVRITATETATTTAELVVSRWTDSEVVAALPVDARTGRLRLTRPDGQFVEASLPVLTQRVDQVADQEHPFELVGTGLSNGRSVAALYREDGEFQPFEGAIERLYDGVAEGVPWAPRTQTRRASSIAGTYDPGVDRFLFVAADGLLTMTTALVSSSTVTPDPMRLPIGVTAGLADRVSVVILGGGLPGEVPAMVAFTVAGTIRTATVTDARFFAFDGFYAASSTTAEYERVTLGKRSDGALLMAHRTVTGTVAQLSLRDNLAGVDPSAFVPRPRAGAPSVGDNFEVLAVPQVPGGPDRFLVAYEALRPDGTTDVRLMWADDYGQGPGVAPFAPGDRRLDDVGLVIREGQVYVAVVATRLVGSAELAYTEVPLSAITAAGGPAGAYPGVLLDIAPDDHVARLGCKPFVQRACPIVWLGDDAGVLFYRY